MKIAKIVVTVYCTQIEDEPGVSPKELLETTQNYENDLDENSPPSIINWYDAGTEVFYLEDNNDDSYQDLYRRILNGG